MLASPRRLLDDEMNTESAAAAFRDTLARAYLALGRKQQAAAAFDALVKSGFEGVHLPITFVRSLYTLGRLEIELGDRQRGRAHLQQFLEYWSHSDWSLDEVRDARTRLAGQTRD